MRIAIITTTFKPELSGIAEAVYKRIKVISGISGVEILLLAPDYSPIANCLPDYKNYVGRIFENVEVKPYPSYSPGIKTNKEDGRVIGPFWKYSLDTELEKFKPDIIHVDEPERLFGARVTDGYLKRVGIGYARKNKIPVVAMWHTDYYKYAEYFVNAKILVPVARFLFKRIVKFVYNAYDLCICSTQEGMKTLQSFGINKLKYMNSLGVDLENFKKLDIEKDESVINLLYVGRITPEKNLEVLFQAFCNLLPAYPHLRLHIVGDGPSLKELQKLYGKNRYITFYGKIKHEELPQYYSKGDVFVNPSFTETFGLVNIEAAACSLPIIAAREGGNLETVIEGYNGFLFTPKGVKELTSKIEELITDRPKMESFSKKSRELSQNYSIVNAGHNFIEVWSSLVRDKKTAILSESQKSRDVHINKAFKI